METSKEKRGAPIDLKAVTFDVPGSQGIFQHFCEWMGDDQREIDPSQLDKELHTNTKILLDDEKCIMAFRAGRDVSIFTNLRFMEIDVQGFSGAKVEYTSIPYRNIHAWAVETTGKYDRDSELSLYTRNRWFLAKVKLDFMRGKADIMQIQQMLSAVCVGLPDDPKLVFRTKSFENKEQHKFEMGDMFVQRSNEIDPGTIEGKFRFEIPLLLEKERILRAFEEARDMYLFTDRRYIIVDTKGMSGQKVKYKSIPYKDVGCFAFETAGNLDKDAEIYMYTDVSDDRGHGPPRSCGLQRPKQSIAIKTTDIYEIGALVMEHTMMKEKKAEVVAPDFGCEWY